MLPAVIQPWGYPPSPLLPKSILHIVGYLEAPDSLNALLGRQARLSELDYSMWSEIDHVDSNCLTDIVNIVKPHITKFSHISIYPNHSEIPILDSLPFSTRTKNAVLAHGDLFKSKDIRFHEILMLPSVGLRSAIEFAALVEAALISKEFSKNDTGSELEEVKSIPEYAQISDFFRSLSAWAVGEQNQTDLNDLLPKANDSWPPDIQELWNKLNNFHCEALAGELYKNYSVPLLVSQGIAQLDERLMQISRDRIFSIGRQVTLEELGEQYGITRERIRQLEIKTINRLNRFKNGEFLPVTRRAKTLQHKLGSAIPENHENIESALNWVVEDFSETQFDLPFVKALFFWLAGPYSLSGDWLTLKPELETLTISELTEYKDDRGCITFDEVKSVLDVLGIREGYHKRWMQHLGKYLALDEGYIEFNGSLLDKMAALIDYYQKPISVESVRHLLDIDNVRSIRQRLIDDQRFWRINKQNEFVLAGTEGYDEYTGITDEIIQEIELCGGEASIEHLINKLSRVYGVKESSIQAYINTPMFIKTSEGMVRVRDLTSSINVKTNIVKAAACYKNEEVWSWRVRVDKDLLRGSGRLIPNAFAQELGCNLGNKIEIPSEFGPVTISWPLSSTTGASIGSIRQVLQHYDAKLKDYIFVKATKPMMTFFIQRNSSVENEESNLIKLSMMLGSNQTETEDEAIRNIAAALDIPSTVSDEILIEANKCLSVKGESNLAGLIKPPKLSMDDYINNMGNLFK